MASSPEIDPAYFGFTDLHGFKDFVVLVLSCAPDLFPVEDWLAPDQQMDLERAFVGLRYGLDMARKEVGEVPLLESCRELVEQAYAEYQAGRDMAGQVKLEEVDQFLRELPSM